MSLVDGTTCGKDCLLCEFAEECSELGPTKCHVGTFLITVPADETGKTNYCQDCKTSEADMGVLCKHNQGDQSKCSQGWWFEPGDYGHTLLYNQTIGNCIKCGKNKTCSDFIGPE